MDVSKDTLLRKADTLLAEARRMRKLSSQAAGAERDKLLHDAVELESRAARLEKDAVSAKNGVFAGVQRPGASPFRS
jgi:hypothetical protein